MSDIFTIHDFENEQQWLKGRMNGIGGSDASVTIGRNPYKSNVELYEEKIGNQIIFRGMNDDRQREKLKSITFPKGKLTDVWLEEATEFTQADLEIIDDRLRGELPPDQFYQIRMTFNPVNKNHWIKKVFFDIPDPNVLTHHSTYLGNRFIDNAYRERMERRKIVDPEGYQIYGLGEWGEIGGLILHNWEVREVSQNTSSTTQEDSFDGLDKMLVGTTSEFNSKEIIDVSNIEKMKTSADQLYPYLVERLQPRQPDQRS